MSVRPRYRAVALASVGILVAILFVPPPGPAAVAEARPVLASLPSTSPCAGSELAHNYTGSVSIVGSSFVPAVSLIYSYYAFAVGRSTSGTTSQNCDVENGSVRPAANGTFDLSILVGPQQTCTPEPSGAENCTILSGPFGAVTLTPALPNPAGYLPTVTQAGTVFQVAYYPDLASVVLTPSGPSVTYSSQAVEEVRAEPLSGLGSPSPVTPQFDWSLSGTGWSFVTPAEGGEVNITATVGAAVGNLSVVADLAAVTGELLTPPSGIALVAVSTAIASAELNRTDLDVGQSVGVELNGSGAAGYNYTASVDPGLGLPAESLPCTSEPGPAGIATLGCAATLTYSAVGTAQPVVSLSNGVSSAVWQFPDVTIDPPPSIVIGPATPTGYVDTPVSVTVAVASGTGTSPYAEACLASGNGAVACLESPGPSWTFAPVYAKTGNYTAVAWAIDAVGVNRSSSTTVRVVGPLSLSLIPPASNGSAGVPLTLAATVAGGALPAHVWWNATGLSSPIAVEVVRSDGKITATFVPSAAGFVTVSVEVVDALGTIEEGSESFSVTVGLATSVVAVVLPSPVSAVAGSPVALTWQALNAVGDAVRSFASAAEIELSTDGTGRTAEGWVNASGVGPLASPLPGWFDVPPAAWIDGALNVMVTPETAGTLALSLTVAASLASPIDPLAVLVVPDIDHLRLFDPAPGISGGRSSDTLWRVTDRFGNPAYGASLFVTTSVGGTSIALESPVFAVSGGGTAVWVNYTAPGAGAATVTVTDLAGDLLLSPIVLPAAPGPFALLVPAAPLLVGVGIGGATAATSRVRWRRRQREALAADDDEAALQRLAEGRATIVEIVRRGGPVDLAGLSEKWEPPPGPNDLADWVASLVTDGTLDAALGPDGIARFCLAPHRPSTAQITVDVTEFDRAQLRRDEVIGMEEDR